MRLTTFLKGMGLGAALMYLYDPNSGRRRRSLVRDQFMGNVHSLQHFVDVGVRDLNNRLCGIQAEVTARLNHEQPSDDVLTERVRAAMGHHVSHPSAIEVSVRDGEVSLSGPILAEEVRHFISAVWNVRGVRQVHNRLEVHEHADIPSLQGGTRSRAQVDLLRRGWTPGVRLLATAAGLVMMTNCLVQRRPSTLLTGTLGFGLFVRATTNQTPGQLIAPTHGIRPPGENSVRAIPQQN